MFRRLILMALLLIAGLGAARAADADPGCARDDAPRRALDDFVEVYMRGDLAAISARLDPAMPGLALFLDGAALDAQRSQAVRIHLFDTAWQCGPDLVVLQASWEKRFLDAATYRQRLTSGRMSVLLFRAAERWRIAAVAGPHPFGGGGAALAEIEFGPTVALGTGPGVQQVPVRLLVADADLVRRASVQVLIASSTGDREVFTLPATTPGRFERASLPVQSAPAVPGNGVLELAPGATLRLEYVDEQPGEGRPATVLRRIATVAGTPTPPTPADTTPDAFVLGVSGPVPFGQLKESNPVTIQGVSVPVTISVVGGSYSVNGGPLTSAPGLVRSGDVVVVALVANGNPGGSATLTLTVGTFTTSLTIVSDV